MSVPGFRFLPRVVRQTNTSYNAVVLFLHGSGDTGDGLIEWLRLVYKEDFTFPHIKIIFPTANLIPYTPFSGRESTVWFDRDLIAPTVPENKVSIDTTAAALSHIVQREIDQGVPASRIVIGGFSMGAAMALHLGYRYHRDVPGVFALSGFLNHGSSVFKEVEGVKNLPELFQCHGERDELVQESWGRETFDKLTRVGVKGEYHTFNVFHEFNKRELLLLREWILKILPV